MSIDTNLFSVEVDTTEMEWGQIPNQNFNAGIINHPMMLIQNLTSGIQIYRRGGNPNTNPDFRIRGFSSFVGKNEPLIIIDGFRNASLDNIDPNDIEKIEVLKDGLSAGVYGWEGDNGVIKITTKSRMKEEPTRLTFKHQIGIAIKNDPLTIFTADEFLDRGGLDLGSKVDYQEEISRTGLNFVNHLAYSGSLNKINYRISGTARNIGGVLKNSGFEKYNGRLSLNTKLMNDKLNISVHSAITSSRHKLGFEEAFRYAASFNPTAPILAKDAPFPFNEETYGGYFQTICLFDSYNPVALIQQNESTTNKFGYSLFGTIELLLSSNVSMHINGGFENNSLVGVEKYPSTSLFRLFSFNENHLATINKQNNEFRNNQLELFFKYNKKLNKSEIFYSIGMVLNNQYVKENNNLFRKISAEDFETETTDISTLSNSKYYFNEPRRVGGFTHARIKINNLSFDTKVKASKDEFKNDINYYGSFGAQLQIYKNTALHTNYNLGSIYTSFKPNTFIQEILPKRSEFNIGVSIASKSFGINANYYYRSFKNALRERPVDIFTNINSAYYSDYNFLTGGLEVDSYLKFKIGTVNFNTSINASTYSTKMLGPELYEIGYTYVGGPGFGSANIHFLEEGEEIGQIVGLKMIGVDEFGNAVYEDFNNNGIIDVYYGPSQESDIVKLGRGLPIFELGIKQFVSYRDWFCNVSFGGTFGHSLLDINGLINQNNQYSSFYNSVKKKGEPVYNNFRISSLNVNSANYISLNNLSIGKEFENFQLSLNIQNVILFTNYSGSSPVPAIYDAESTLFGNLSDFDHISMSPGVDRRNYYAQSNIYTLSLILDM